MLKQIKKIPTTVSMNYYKFKTTGDFYKYQIQCEPQIDDQDESLLKRIMRLCLQQLRDNFKKFSLSNKLVFYSAYLVDDFNFTISLIPDECSEETEPLEYNINVRKTGTVDVNRPEHVNVIGRFFKTMQASLKLKSFGRAYFDPSQKRDISSYKLETWPGYETQVKLINNQVLLCVESCTKVIRLDSALQALQQLRSSGKSNEQMNEAFHNITVVTSYNKRNYRVEGIDYQQSPQSVFSLKGVQTSYVQYYKNMYNIGIQDMHQPLLVYIDRRMEKRTGNKQEPIYLVPELCYMTGLTDQHRNNFHLMKEIAKDTKQEASVKQKTIQGLIQRLHSEETPKNIMKSNKIEVDSKPLQITGFKLQPGSLTFDKKEVKVGQDNREFDKQVQTKFLQSVDLIKWAIFYCQKDQDAYIKFQDMFMMVMNQYEQKALEPKVVALNSTQQGEWIQALQVLDPSVNIVVALLPGPKKNAPLYKEVKKQCHMRGVPCQVILTKTLQSSGLRSICNKVLTQMCAKLGGVPWGMNDMPFTSSPTMLIGIDMYQKASGGRKYVMGLIGTLDKNLAKYHSEACLTSDLEEAHASVYHMSKLVLERFRSLNKMDPQVIIVYREGASEGQVSNILEKEITGSKENPQGITKAMLELQVKAQLVVITVVKRVNAKIFGGGGAGAGGDNMRVTNPEPGTLVCSDVVDSDSFLLVSCKQTQGMTSPTKYQVIYNDLGNSQQVMDMLYQLTYKQTHMYYNWAGPVKVPAPCKNVNLLVNFHGERFDEIIAHKALAYKNSQYFI